MQQDSKISKETLQEFGIGSSLIKLFQAGKERGSVSISEILEMTPTEIFKDYRQAKNHLERITETFEFFGVEITNGNRRIKPEIQTNAQKQEQASLDKEKRKPLRIQSKPTSFFDSLKRVKQLGVKNQFALNYFWHEVKQYPFIPPEQENELIKKAQQEETEAKDRIVGSNLKFVAMVAKNYLPKTDNSLDLLDLIQEGSIGLLKAIDKFDENKGCTLKTYAHWWIRQTIQRAIMDQCGIIRKPAYAHQEESDIKKTINSYKRNFKRDPTVEELQEALNWPKKKVLARLETINSKINSLEEDLAPNKDNESRNLMMTTENPQAKNPEDVILAKDELKSFKILISQIFDILEKETLRDRNIFRMRYGLDGTADGKVLEEIGKYYGVTRERIRQICNKVLKKLYHNIKPEGVPYSMFGIWVKQKIQEAKNAEVFVDEEVLSFMELDLE